MAAAESAEEPAEAAAAEAADPNQAAAAAAAHPWISGYSAEGHLYYYNTLTEEASWTMPDEMAAAEAAAAEAAAAAEGGAAPAEGGLAAVASDAPPQLGVGGGVGGGVRAGGGLDALERPPHPCFSWGFGGSLAACFPGQPGAAPQLLVSPVEALLTDADLLSEARSLPGPLTPTPTPNPKPKPSPKPSPNPNLNQVRSFPGPLTRDTSKAEILSYTEAHVARAEAEVRP